MSTTDLWHAARLQDKIEDLQSKLAAVQEQRTQLRSRSRMLATALQLRKEELRKLRERQAQVSARAVTCGGPLSAPAAVHQYNVL